ncbi:hypothetical protein ACQ4PT_065515 [Festuca glaucescens]
MAGKESTARRGKKTSTSRRGRRTSDEEGGFSLGHCTTTDHVAVEAAATGDDAGFSLGPCTTTKHMAVEQAAATGEESVSLGPCTATKPTAVEKAVTKRKSALEYEAFDMFSGNQSLFGHWANPLYKPVDASGKDMVLEPVDLFTEDELRKRVASVLLTFPECGALGRKELEEAIERIVKESRPETASAAAPGMVRLADDDIPVLLVMGDTPTVDELPGVGPGGVFPPGWLDDRRKELEKECQPEKKKKIGRKSVLGDKVRVDLITKGYVEIHEDYMGEDPDVDPYEGRVLMDFSNVVFAPDDFEGEVMILPPPDGYQEEVD